MEPGLQPELGANLKYNSFAGGSEAVNSSEQGLGFDFGLLLDLDELTVGLAVRSYTKLSGTLMVDGEAHEASTKLPLMWQLALPTRRGRPCGPQRWQSFSPAQRCIWVWNIKLTLP